VAAAFATAQDGDTIAFAAGTYTFTNQLALGTANGVTVIGAGQSQTTLDFSGQKAGEDGIFAQSVQNLTFQGFSVKDTPGNAFKTLGVTGVTWRDVGASWTALDDTDGAYGFYPVQSTQVLVEHCTVSGASDSGIYVGQSQQIVIRNNEVFSNVAGIEIENSFFADVHDNNAHDNTGGILVFDLPGLQQEGGHDVRVFNNTIHQNNTKNFAVKSDIVSKVPGGTGFFVMANHDVEVFGNAISGNDTLGAGVISYAVAQDPITDPSYYEWPANISLHDNTYSGNGSQPDAYTQMGLLLATGMGTYPGGHVPDVLWDGITDPAKGTGPNPMTICINEPSASAVCDMHFDKVDLSNPNLNAMACDPAPFQCTLAPLAAVTWQGLSP
jgi:parallel beta-helix repeat protein